ncbi:hypothetical protein N7466_007823 [Penicillium verhagenii]|uniref:uncharacterized protein n=1 Tax=Penicillium verhagenii TaxID=1562060 RepID=UPI002544FCF9|nr:uncharacterized protein N7466_007823 [Penicillium verhagenii]KAJ5928867.1 hypothetical protein N7466_007823 [Penicillium verhagenii]
MRNKDAAASTSDDNQISSREWMSNNDLAVVVEGSEKQLDLRSTRVDQPKVRALWWSASPVYSYSGVEEFFRNFVAPA